MRAVSRRTRRRTELAGAVIDLCRTGRNFLWQDEVVAAAGAVQLVPSTEGAGQDQALGVSNEVTEAQAQGAH